MERQFCYLCSGKLEQTGGHSWKCTECRQSFYRNGQAAQNVALVNSKGELMVVIRSRDPGKGLHDLPGGFVDPGEDFETTLYREMKEEVDVDATDVEDLHYVASESDEYPWGNEVIYVTSAMFKAKLKEGVVAKPADDVESIEWHNLPTYDADQQYFASGKKLVKLLQQDIDKKA